MRSVEGASPFRPTGGMITVGIIRNGSNYLAHHLRRNDYWTEGEKEVQGEWIASPMSAPDFAAWVAARSGEKEGVSD